MERKKGNNLDIKRGIQPECKDLGTGSLVSKRENVCRQRKRELGTKKKENLKGGTKSKKQEPENRESEKKQPENEKI